MITLENLNMSPALLNRILKQYGSVESFVEELNILLKFKKRPIRYISDIADEDPKELLSVKDILSTQNKQKTPTFNLKRISVGKPY